MKIFVTHGGVLSTIESIHFGVPMLFIPFSGDQPMNAAYAESRKFGRILTPKDITEENVFNAIEEMLENPE